MSIISRHKGVGLDEKECFELWASLGTLKKVSEHLSSEGKLSPYSGKPYTIGAIRFAAYRWVVENHTEARKYYVEAGSPLSLDEWNRWIVRTAAYVYQSRRRFFKWLDENDFQEYEKTVNHRFRRVSNNPAL